jgi:cytochrome c biogenesis protein CcmG, thiol:disulfide interchange protein DsbE
MAELTDLTHPTESAHPAGTTGSAADAPVARPSQAAFLFWRLFFIGILALFLGLLAWRLYQTNVSEQRADGMAPAIVFATFDGDVISLDDLRGQGVVVNFWASWCDPCREEAVLLEETWRREQANGIMFLGLDYLDQEPAALAYLAEFDITYPNGPDLRSEAARRYGIKGVPETFFIDPDGRIVGSIIGPVLSEDQLDNFLDRIRP